MPPNRFRPVINAANGYLSSWAPETDDVRKLIRGFFIRKATPDPETSEYSLLLHELTSGETVRLEVRVYNYTLSEQNGHIGTLPVHFYATSRDWSNSSNPVDYVQEIGWTPLGVGPHTLYARLLELGMDTQPGNNVATLKWWYPKNPFRTKP
jgi:hypothetical protein